MERLILLGTCCGAEPIENMHHQSFVLEVDGEYYFFDAGENCSRTACSMGIDLLKVRSIFITHAHMDHVGGLANLLWNIRKFWLRTGIKPLDDNIDLYIPNKQSIDAIFEILKNAEDGFATDYSINVNITESGIIYKDKNISVTAVSNHHIEVGENEKPVSYSYIVDTKTKRVVITGDVRDFNDVEPLVEKKCDYLFMETGHHKVSDVLEFVKNHSVGKLIFVHNGREIINNRQACQKLVDESGVNAIISSDREIVQLD